MSSREKTAAIPMLRPPATARPAAMFPLRDRCMASGTAAARTTTAQVTAQSSSGLYVFPFGRPSARLTARKITPSAVKAIAIKSEGPGFSPRFLIAM